MKDNSVSSGDVKALIEPRMLWDALSSDYPSETSPSATTWSSDDASGSETNSDGIFDGLPSLGVL